MLTSFLTALPSQLQDNGSASVYLLDWCLSLFVAVGFVFYFHRLMGVIISYIFKATLWKMLKIRITVQSIKFSLLGGRLFAKNVTIVSVDQSISILNITITWRYWLLKLARLSNFYYSEHIIEPDKDKTQNDSLPSRIVANIEGLEIFIHNRSFAYNQILETLNDLQDKKEGESSETTSNEELKPEEVNSPSTSEESTEKAKTIDRKNYTLRFLLKMLPIRMRIKRGAIVMGNFQTPSIVVLSYKSAQGVIDITKASNSLDNYRFLHNFTLEKFQISLKDNISYDKDKCDKDNSEKTKQSYHYKGNPYINQFKASIAIIKKVSNKLRRRKKVVEEDEVHEEWKGLKRYINSAGDSNIQAVFNDEEYAKNSLIVDAASARLNYYYDSPGLTGIPKGMLANFPEHGLEMELSLATIHYGAWADKQRVPIQNVFFPNLFRDSKPTPVKADPHALRQYSGFKVNISVKDELVIKIPTRESSKDKELLRTHAPTSKLTRPFGWLELRMKEGSNISQFTSYIGTEKEGWPNKLNTFFNDLEIRTSVNHDIFFKAKSHELTADIGFPLKWNGTPHWKFDNVSEDGELFFLREHTLLFSDLFTDFATGEPTPYELFKCFLYKINWKMNGYKIFLNVNDQNIINNPLDFSNNTYLSFQGSDLDIQMDIPLNGSLSKSTTVSYNIFTPRFELVLDTPPWHTVQAFLKESNVVGCSDNFEVDGGYTFFDLVEVNASNYMEIRCTGDNTTLLFYGFVIKYLFTIRDNYFGDNIHFKTFEEYTSGMNSLSLLDSKSVISTNEEHPLEGELDYWKILKTDNDDDIFFTFQIRHALVILPSNIYDCKSHIGISFDYLDVDIRFTNFYMDLQADISPAKGVYVDELMGCTGEILRDTHIYKQLYMGKSPDIEIDGLSIHAHRMFGVPPLEITYNAKWDFAMGAAEINSTPSFLSCLATSIKSFAFGYIDFDNSLNVPEPLVFDAFSITFKCPSFIINLSSNPLEVVSIDLNSILLSYLDYPNKRYSSRASVLIPVITINIFELVDDERACAAYIKTGLILDVFGQKRNLEEVLRQKQEHLYTNDAPFHRNPYLVFDENRDQAFANAYGSLATSLSLPTANFPLVKPTNNSSSSFDASSTYFDGSGIGFLPIHDYEDEDFTPQYRVDKDTEYDSIVLEFLETQVALKPQAIMILANLINSSKELPLLTIVDALQIQIGSNLKKLMRSLNETINFRIIIPEISLKFGDLNLSNPAELFRKSPTSPVLNLVLSEASVAMSLTEQKDERVHLINTKELFTIAFHMKELYFSVSNPSSDFSFPLMISIRNIEFWNESSTFENLVLVPTIDSINCEIQDSQISWLIDFAWYLYKEIQPSIEMLLVQSKSLDELCAEMVYKLSVASTIYRIDHDPEVLTKPAYILRSKKDHVRFYDGWKVMTRLKHIFDNLPEQWKDEQSTKIHDPSWVLPSNAYDEVKSIFSRWRGWEANNEQRDFFFNHIFRKKSATSKGIEVKISISAIQLKVISSTNRVDLVNLNNISTICQYRPLESESFNRFGIEILDFAKHTDVVVSLEQFSLDVSTVVLELAGKILSKLQYLKQEYGEIKEVEPPSPLHDITQNIIAKFAVTFKKYDLNLTLPSSSFSINGRASTTSGEMVLLKDSPFKFIFTMSTFTEYFLASISNLRSNLVNFSINQFATTAANSGMLFDGLRVVETSIGRTSLEFLDENMSLPADLNKIIDNDINLVKKLLAIGSDVRTNDKPIIQGEKEDQLSFENIGDFSVKIRLHQFIFVCDVLQPLKIAGEFENITVSALKTGDTVHFQNFIKRIQGNAKVDKVSVLELSTSNIQADAKFNMTDDQILAIISTSLGYTRVQVPQLINSVKAVSRYRDQIQQRLDDLTGLSNKSSTIPGSTVKSTEETPGARKCLFKLKFTNEYFGLSTSIHKAKFALEIEETSLGVYNVDNTLNQSANNLHIKVPIFGELGIQNARFSVQDSILPVKLSQIVEVNVAASVFNKADNLGGLQTLQIRSQYCRVCLSTPAVFKLVGLFDTISALTPNLEVSIKTNESNMIEQKPTSLVFSKLSSIQVLSYNFCLGWIFDNNRKDYPGIIIGAERFFAIAEQDLGKYTLMEAYVSVANGARSSNFYSNGSQKTNLNRAYLPKMQLVYSIEENAGVRNMLVLVTGDEVDIKFLSNSVVILEETVASINELQSHLKNRTRNVSQEATKKKIEVIPDEDKFHSPFDTIEVITTFAGSRILFYHIDDCDPESPSSLLLISPAVKIAGKYINRNRNNQKHIIKLDILTSSSENVLYSTCVPTIVDLIEGMQSMMKKANSKGNREVAAVETKQGVDLDLGKIFNDIDLHVGVKIEKQLLTLSCEPTAKVAAIVGVDGIYIQVNTLVADFPKIFAAVYFSNLSASLQHIYSREISGSARIERIIATSSLEFKEVASVLSSGSIVNVQSYVNIKQYQDLELFKDIWFPRKHVALNVEKNTNPFRPIEASTSTLATNKSISNRFKEVSTTYAFPWVITFIMTNANVQVDFGQALGNFNLQLDNVWAVSKKSTDWSQELKLGVNKIVLLSSGRMGTSFIVKDINLHTAIAWKVDSGVILDVPLVLISGGIDDLSLKLSFDYHVFCMASIQGLSMDVFNQKGEASIMKDHVLANIRCDAAEVYGTSLAASNFWDIHNTVSRMMQEKTRSYKEILHDSSESEVKPTFLKSSTNDILETVKKLESTISLSIGHLYVYVFPSSFDDTKVLVVKLDESQAYFQQNEYSYGISNDLNVKFNDLKISLSKTVEVSEQFVNECTVGDFIAIAHKAHGGHLFLFPSYQISMRSYQKYGDNIVEYFYQSSFGGTVNVRWNLGSVNLIREMITMHQKTLETRTSYDKVQADVSLNEEMFTKRKEIFNSANDNVDPREEIEHAIEETITKVSRDSKYTYVPLAPPIIAAPQLKELGNATPPLEWFGLHRNKFPDVTHQMGIVSLQKLIHEVEMQYSKLLGKA